MSKDLWAHNVNIENACGSSEVNNDPSKSIVCNNRGSWADVVRAKVWPDKTIIIKVTAEIM